MLSVIRFQWPEKFRLWRHRLNKLNAWWPVWMVCKRLKSARFHILICELYSIILDRSSSGFHLITGKERRHLNLMCWIYCSWRRRLLDQISWSSHCWSQWQPGHLTRTSNDLASFCPVGIDLVFLPSAGSCTINTHSYDNHYGNKLRESRWIKRQIKENNK